MAVRRGARGCEVTGAQGWEPRVRGSAPAQPAGHPPPPPRTSAAPMGDRDLRAPRFAVLCPQMFCWGRWRGESVASDGGGGGVECSSDLHAAPAQKAQVWT